MLALTIISTIVSAYSAMQQQRAQNKAARYNKEMQLRNAGIAEMQAKAAEEKGKTQEKQLRLQIAQKKGQQQSALAAAGVVVGEGTALETLENTAAMGEQDALTLRHNTAMEAWGLRTQAGGYQGQAQLEGAKQSSVGLAGTSSILQSAPSLYSAFQQRKTTTTSNNRSAA